MNFRINLQSAFPVNSLVAERRKKEKEKLKTIEYLENEKVFFGKLKRFFMFCFRSVKYELFL